MPPDRLVAADQSLTRRESWLLSGSDTARRSIRLNSSVECLRSTTLLEVSRAGHRAWIERTLLRDGVSGDLEQVVLALYAATDVTVWKLLRRDLGQTRPVTESVILRLVTAVLDGNAAGKDRGS